MVSPFLSIRLGWPVDSSKSYRVGSAPEVTSGQSWHSGCTIVPRVLFGVDLGQGRLETVRDLVALLEEGAPGAERQSRLDRHVADLDVQVPPRPAEAVNAAGEVLARGAEDAVDDLPGGVASLLGAERERRQERDGKSERGGSGFHFGFLLPPLY